MLATAVWLVVRPLMIIGLEWAVAVVMQTGACFSAVAITVYVGGTAKEKGRAAVIPVSGRLVRDLIDLEVKCSHSIL